MSPSWPAASPGCPPRSARSLPAVELAAVPTGGLHVWVRLPAGVDDVELADLARRRDVIVEPGRSYFVTEPPAAHLRLTYGAATPAELAEATRRLAEALDQIP
jgi:DNA-binding transcriptional MocR family regulator